MTLYDYAKSIGLNPLVALAIFANCNELHCHNCPLKHIDCVNSFNKAREDFGLVIPFTAGLKLLDRAKEIKVNIKNKE